MHGPSGIDKNQAALNLLMTLTGDISIFSASLSTVGLQGYETRNTEGLKDPFAFKLAFISFFFSPNLSLFTDPHSGFLLIAVDYIKFFWVCYIILCNDVI